jgi:hypothetical protein
MKDKTVIQIVRKNIMQYVDVIGEDLAEMIVMGIAEDLDDMEDDE